MLRTNHIGCVGEQQFGLTPFAPCGKQAAGMIEVQVAEHHHVDVLVLETRFAQ